VFKRLFIWLLARFMVGQEIIEIDGFVITRRWRISGLKQRSETQLDVVCFAPGGTGALQIDQRRFSIVSLRYDPKLKVFVLRNPCQSY
jgi:hypothetical protein